MSYSIQSVVDGFPGKSASHGGFGWSSVYLARSAERTVLVETGPPSYIPLLNDGLAAAGIAADQITDILLTHAHWDHVSNFMMFPRATIWIGRTELEWARDLGADEPFISTLHIERLQDLGDQVTLISGSDEPLPGIRAIDTPGHTPGHLAFEVMTDDTPVIFAGDAVKNLRELATADVDSTMDRPASLASVERLRSLMSATDATVVPGHDVPLRVEHGRINRTRIQEAHIEFFDTAAHGPVDRSISDGPAPQDAPPSRRGESVQGHTDSAR